MFGAHQHRPRDGAFGEQQDDAVKGTAVVLCICMLRGPSSVGEVVQENSCIMYWGRGGSVAPAVIEHEHQNFECDCLP